ncbi:MAG: hypothetical protein VX519_08510, partial [Myxococcota bacterium]|nr:hypothetical protein [Myxococcota bacterium]
PDEAAAVFVEISGEPVTCRMRFDIDDQGRQRSLVMVSCPQALKNSTKAALSEWKFLPPSRGDKAEWTKHEIDVVFQSNVVASEQRPDLNGFLVQVPPYATPRWAASPLESRAVTRWMREKGVDSVKCTAELAVGEMGIPTQFELLDCPPFIGKIVEKQSNRWGFGLVGATESDGSRFQMELERSSSE